MNKAFSLLAAIVFLSVAIVSAQAADTTQNPTTERTTDTIPPPGWSSNLERAQADAAKGNPKAEFYLGWVYEEGKGVAQDFTKAKEWYLKAAEQGNTDAQSNLGDMYMRGKGMPRDVPKAVEWFRKAAEKKNAMAENNLGLVYLEDWDGVSRDLVKAYVWSSLAADQGIVQAKKNTDIIAAHMTPEQKTEAERLLQEKQAALSSAPH